MAVHGAVQHLQQLVKQSPMPLQSIAAILDVLKELSINNSREVNGWRDSFCHYRLLLSQKYEYFKKKINRSWARSFSTIAKNVKDEWVLHLFQNIMVPSYIDDSRFLFVQNESWIASNLHPSTFGKGNFILLEFHNVVDDGFMKESDHFSQTYLTYH